MHQLWEYTSFRDRLNETVKLNELGRDGWELVNVVVRLGGDLEFFFKRPCSPKPRPSNRLDPGIYSQPGY